MLNYALSCILVNYKRLNNIFLSFSYVSHEAQHNCTTFVPFRRQLVVLVDFNERVEDLVILKIVLYLQFGLLGVSYHNCLLRLAADYKRECKDIREILADRRDIIILLVRIFTIEACFKSVSLIEDNFDELVVSVGKDNVHPLLLVLKLALDDRLF